MGKIIPALGAVIKLIFLVSAAFGAPNVRDGTLIHHQGEPESLNNCRTSQNHSNLSSFEFNPYNIPPDDSTCLSLKMFKDMGFVQQFHIPIKKLSRFILKAQKGYRDVPFHNWNHGFAVLHFTFAVLKNCGNIEKDCFTVLQETQVKFTAVLTRPLEGLALLTAAMCHDLDHPGTNSQFQEETHSAMARLYREKGSILERHHLEKTFNLLKDPETDFVEQLSENDRRQFMNIVRQVILATDLTRHFKDLPEEQKMARQGFDGTNEQHRHLLRSIVISSADLSHLTKDWATARKSAKLVFIEFFNQGDKEKEMGFVPAKMMDRNQANVAEEQVNFISKVASPLFTVLESLCPETQVCVDSLDNNKKYWEKAVPYFVEQSKRGRAQLEILNDREVDEIPTVTLEK